MFYKAILLLSILLPAEAYAQRVVYTPVSSQESTIEFLKSQMERAIVVQKAFKKTYGQYGTWDKAANILGSDAVDGRLKVMVTPAPDFRYGFKIAVTSPDKGLTCYRLYGTNGIRSEPTTISYPADVVCKHGGNDNALKAPVVLSDDLQPKVPSYLKNRKYKTYPPFVGAGVKLPPTHKKAEKGHESKKKETPKKKEGHGDKKPPKKAAKGH